MTFYNEQIYPFLVNRLGNPKPVQQLRQRIIPLAQGIVLEIGVGSGTNFPYYDPAKVRLLYALEPNPGMLRLAEVERRKTAINVQFLDLPGERIPLEFYKRMFGIEPSKVRKGYAKFDVSNPPLNFTPNEVPFGERGALFHMGIQIGSTDDVLAVRQRWFE
jgi:hypothetical protein